MKAELAAALCAASVIGITPACAENLNLQGVNDRFQITAPELSACGSDAIALCASAYPDEQKVHLVRLSASGFLPSGSSCCRWP